MTVNFPTSPSDGTTHTSNTKTWTYDSAKTKWKLNDAAGGGLNIFGNTTSSVADTAALNAKTGMAVGDQIYVEDINKLYKYSGSAWILVASLTNSPPPALDSLPEYIYLRVDGVANSVTLTETDPEGYPLTWSYAVTAGSVGNICTVNLTNNVLTFTPSTNATHAGSFGITVSVTDHMNTTVTKSSTVILDFTLKIRNFGHYDLKDAYADNNYYTKSVEFWNDMRSYNALTFSPDGLRAWQIGKNRDELFEYALSSAWDVSTMNIDYTKQTVQLRGYIGELVKDMSFNNDGTKMYFAFGGNEPVSSQNKLIQVDLGTAYEPTTIDGSSIEYLTAEHPTAPHTHVEGFCFSANGSYLYITEDGVDDIFQFTLSTPWDITTAAYTAIKEAVGNNFGLHISSDGSNMYLMSTNGGSATITSYMKQCTMSTPYDITTLNYSSPTNTLTYRYQYSNENAAANTWNSSYLPSTYINTPEPLDFVFSPDGTKFIMFGILQNSSINQTYNTQSITLSTPWDISVSSQSSSTLKEKILSILPDDDKVDNSFVLSPDGNTFYIKVTSHLKSPDYITHGYKQFSLAETGKLQSIQFQSGDYGSLTPDFSLFRTDYGGSTPIGLSFSEGTSIGNMAPRAMTFNHNGTKLIVSPQAITSPAYFGNSHIFQWDVPSAYDITTISSSNLTSPYYVDLNSLTGQSNVNSAPAMSDRIDSMTFSGDGSKFYYITNGRVLQFSCSTNGSVFSMTLDTTSSGATGYFHMYQQQWNSPHYGGLFTTVPNIWNHYMNHLGRNQDHSALQGITWHPDGYKVYFATNVANAFPCIVELTVATQWNLFTVEHPLKQRWAVFGGRFPETTTGIADFIGDLQWNSDGTILYTTIKTASEDLSETSPESNVLEFPYLNDALSYNGISAETPYNLKWAYGDDIFYHNLAEPTAFQIKPDGTKFWICDNTTDDVIEYNMSTPHQLSSATIGNRLLNVEANASGMYFAPDGSHLITCGYSSDKVRKWDMSTAWDISTATVDATQEIALSSGGTTDGMLWVQYNNDGTKIYVYEEEITTATMSGKLLEYPLSTAYDLSTAGTPYVWEPQSSVVQPDRPTRTWSNDDVTIQMGRFNDFGNTLILSTDRDSAEQIFYSFALSTAWDLSTINNTPSGEWATPYDDDWDRSLAVSSGQDHLIYLDLKHIFRIYRS